MWRWRSWEFNLVRGRILAEPGFSASSSDNNMYIKKDPKITTATIYLTPLSLAKLNWQIQAIQEARNRGGKNGWRTGTA